MQRFLLICALPKQSAPDWQAAQGEAAKLFAELGGDARGAYIATTAYSWFLFRDSHDRTKQARHQAAQEAVERHLGWMRAVRSNGL